MADVDPKVEAKVDAIGADVDLETGPPPKKSIDSTDSESQYALGEFWDKMPAYKDINSEAAHSKADSHGHSRGPMHWARTVFRSKSTAWQPILMSVAWSTLVVYLAKLAARDFPQDGCRWFCSRIALDATTHSYVGFALFLLLGFRVNESYQRYLDGLKIWTGIAGTCGSMSKYFLQAFRPGMFHAQDRERMLGWLVAFPVALKRELRNERDLRELKGILAPEDMRELQNASSMSSHTLYVLSAYIMQAQRIEKKFPQTFLVHLIGWIASLAEAADNCNQIKTMPCAFSYVAHLRTFLMLWLVLLPFTLVETIAWGTPLVVAFITYGVVGVELNAQELENPFGRDFNDIPLGMLTDNIIQNVRETYRSGKSSHRRYVHATGPVQPAEGQLFWLDEKAD